MLYSINSLIVICLPTVAMLMREMPLVNICHHDPSPIFNKALKLLVVFISISILYIYHYQI